MGFIVRSKEVTSKKMKQKQNAASYNARSAPPTDASNWGSIKPGTWGKLDNEEEKQEEKQRD